MLEEFFNQARVFYKPGLEGSKWIRGKFYIGDRAGLQVHIGNLLHEIAHFIEIDDERCFKDDWGLIYPQQPKTFQAVQREARVWGIQWCLCDTKQIKFMFDEHAGLFTHIVGWELMSGTYRTKKDLVKSWIIAEKAKWTKNKILKEWNRKIKL